MTPAEADEHLAQAIRDHARAYFDRGDDELLAEYAVIANWQATDVDDPGQYSMHFSRPNVPAHIARGLFATGLEMVNETLR